jgi:hypothetical protein
LVQEKIVMPVKSGQKHSAEGRGSSDGREASQGNRRRAASRQQRRG